MSLKPLHDRIIVQRIEDADEQIGGIVIPDTAREKPQKGKVVAASSGKPEAEDGRRIPLDVQDGDLILFGKYSGQEVEIDGQQYLIMREDEVLAVIDATPGRSTPSIFVSYPRSRRESATELVDFLQEQDFRTWIDFNDLAPGNMIADEIERAANAASAMIFLLDSDSTQPKQELEWRAGLGSSWSRPEIQVIPVVLNNADVPVFLRSRKTLRWSGSRSDRKFFEQLLGLLRSPAVGTRQRDTGTLERDRQKRFEEIAQMVDAVRLQARDSL